MRGRLALGIAAVAVSVAACSASPAPPTSPLDVRLPHIGATDPPLARAGKLADYIEARWPRIRILRADANGSGTFVAFNDVANYDSSIKDPEDYVQHVQQLSGDLAQASVELLKLSLTYFPNLQYATVWQDRQMQAYWTREDIEAMDRPESYRDYRSFLKLVSTAQYPPFGSPPTAPTS